MLQSSGIVSIVLDIATSDRQVPAVLQTAYRFLAALTKGNPFMQSFLFRNLDRILDCDAASGWENDMGKLLCEIFDNDQANSIGVSKQQVRFDSVGDMAPLLTLI